MSFQVDNAKLELIFAVFICLATRRDALVLLGSFITYSDLKLHNKYKLTQNTLFSPQKHILKVKITLG